MFKLISNVPVSIWDYCKPCEVPYLSYRSVEARGNKQRTFIRVFCIPMNKHRSQVFERKNDNPKGRWVMTVPASKGYAYKVLIRY